MDDFSNTIPFASTSPVRTLSGRKLAGRPISATNRALLAHDLMTGTIAVRHLTRKQAIQFTAASSGYLHTVSKLSPRERREIENGWVTLTELHHRRRSPTNSEVDCIVAELGHERVLSALDRHTRPQIAAE